MRYVHVVEEQQRGNLLQEESKTTSRVAKKGSSEGWSDLQRHMQMRRVAYSQGRSRSLHVYIHATAQD